MIVAISSRLLSVYYTVKQFYCYAVYCSASHANWYPYMAHYSTTIQYYIFFLKTSSMKKETSRYIFLKIVQSHSRHANAWSQLTLYRY